MNNKMHEKYLSKDQLRSMKASTIQKIREKGDTLAAALVLLVAVSFVEIVILVATLLWMNKVTLFLFIIGMLLVAFFSCIYIILFKDYKKTINTYSEEDSE